jgi:nitroimidazol reductase NimA-like FMN-containing flavoprotein (pyridoxamine 5'-phosphate oxidase superfamily)
MRRKDREITDIVEMMAVIKKCSVCRVAFFDAEYPYIVPLNFGAVLDGGQLSLYFHCANAGKKLDLLKKNNKVCFEMDCSHVLYLDDNACQSTMEFESVCGNGTMEMLGEEEKAGGLTFIMRQYSPKTEFHFNENDLKAVTLLKLTVNEVTGKRLDRKSVV